MVDLLGLRWYLCLACVALFFCFAKMVSTYWPKLLLLCFWVGQIVGKLCPDVSDFLPSVVALWIVFHASIQFACVPRLPLVCSVVSGATWAVIFWAHMTGTCSSWRSRLTWLAGRLGRLGRLILYPTAVPTLQA